MKSNLIKSSLLLFLILKISFFSFSQVSITATSNTNTVGMQQQFFVTYTLKGGNSESFEPPVFNNFNVVGQRSQSGGGMTIIVNGQVVSGEPGEQTWTFTLLPTRAGKFTIPAARVKVANQWYSSNTLEINVINTGQAPINPPQTPVQPYRSQPQPQLPQQQTESLNEDDIFIRAIASKNSALVGEPVIITYKIYFRVPIPSYSIQKIPNFEGFWSEELTDPATRPTVVEEIIDGQRYNTAILRRVVVFPQKSGSLTIEPLEVEAIARIVIQNQRRSPFGNLDDIFNNFFNNPFFNDPSSFFGTNFRDVKTTEKSNPVNIRVRDLPTTNRPTDFTGQVGSYSIEAWIDKDRVFVNDVVNLGIRISGNGNMSLLDVPVINFPVGLEVFTPQIENNITKSQSGISGNKVFNFVIIPRNSGAFEIPKVNFSFFDLKTNTYKTLNTQNFKIEVFGADANIQIHNIQTSEDIRFIKINPSNFKTINSFLFNYPVYWLLVLMLLLVFGLILYFLRKKIILSANMEAMKQIKAKKIARKRMKKAEKLLTNNELEKFYDEVSRSLWQYLSDRYKIKNADLSIENVVYQLSIKNVNSEILEKLKKTLEFCEFIRFAPGASSSTPIQVFEDSNEIISLLEQFIFSQNKSFLKKVKSSNDNN